MPGPNQYDTITKWKEAKPKNSVKPRAPPPNKSTFLDDIQKEAKLRYMPGVGSYNLRKDPKDVDKENRELATKISGKGMEKVNFLCQYEYLSNLRPGPGNYNPRQIERKLHQSSMKQKDWIAKHQEQSKRSTRSNYPESCTYNPFPLAYQTFGKLYDINKGKTPNKKKDAQKMWGTATRFKDITKTKSKVTQIFPAPGHYDMIAQWQGKQEGLNQRGDVKKKKDWMRCISKGVRLSIYYDRSGVF